MSKKLRVSANTTLSFPTKCIICGEMTDNVYYKYGIQIEKLSWYVFFFSFSYLKKCIFYPICNKHKILTMMSTYLYWMTIPASIGSLLATIGSYLDKRIDYIMALIFIGSVLLLFITFFYRPLRIENLGHQYMTLVFKNDEYANEFALKNDIYR